LNIYAELLLDQVHILCGHNTFCLSIHIMNCMVSVFNTTLDLSLRIMDCVVSNLNTTLDYHLLGIEPSMKDIIIINVFF